MNNGTPPEIQVSGLSKRYLAGSTFDILRHALGWGYDCDVIEALHNISFAVRRGGLLGVLGRNGAGKSTLLRVVAGVYHPDGGTVVLRSAPTAVFEMGFRSHPFLTGRQFCYRYLALRGVPRRLWTRKAEEVKEFSELDHFFEQPIRAYSSGMTARLYFSAVTSVPAEVILLDEILCVGDAHFAGKSFKRLLRLLDGNTCGVLVSHDWLTATRLCDDILILDQGKCSFLGSAEDAVRQFLAPVISVTGKCRFTDKDKLCSQPVSFVTGETLKLQFDVTCDTDDAVGIAAAIELPKLGMVVAVVKEVMIFRGRGHHRICLQIPRFPIRSRRCYLSLFLSAPLQPGESATREGFDQISWTTGRSIVLQNVAETGVEPVLNAELGWRRINDEVPA